MLLLSVGGVLCVCLLSLIWYKNGKYVAYAGFFVVFFVMAFQYDPITDYIRYQASFEQTQELVQKNGIFNFVSDRVEPGWQVLYNLFAWASFPVMVFCIALFQYLVLVRLTKNYVNLKYQFLAPVLFYFTESFMLMQTTAMRQGLAIELCLLAFFFVDKKKYLWPFLLFGAAFSIHQTALLGVLIVGVYFIMSYFKVLDVKVERNDYWWPIVYVCLFVGVVVLKRPIMNAIMVIGENIDLKDYSYTLMSLGGRRISPLIILYHCVITFINVLYYKYADKQNRFFVISSTLVCFCDMLFFGLGSIPRIFLYFSIFNILLYPNIAKFIAEKYGKIVSVVYIVFCVGYSVKTFIPAVMPPEGYHSFYEFVFLT